MKKKLIASAVSLAMALVMITSASFAWFTVSNAPSVADIDVTMTATKNLEIAKATTNLTDAKPAEVSVGNAGDETKWGATISSFAATLDFPATIPTTGTTANKVSTISYDVGGRVNADYVAAAAPEALTNGVGFYTADIKQGTTPLKSGAKVAAVFGVWLRSNVACTGNDAVTVAVTDANGVAITDSKWGIILASASGTPLANNKVSLTANEATAVQVIIYADGENVKAQNVATDLKLENIKLTFSSSAVGTFAAQHPTPTP